MKTLLTVTALIEAAAGLALLLLPAFVFLILLGTSLNEPSGILMGRLAGTALITLSIICWTYRDIQRSGGVVTALLFYNVAAAALLVSASFTGYSGAPLWATVLLHTVMAVWSAATLRKK